MKVKKKSRENYESLRKFNIGRDCGRRPNNVPRNAGQNRKSVETQGPGWLIPMANPEIIPYKAFSPLGEKKTSEKAKAKETKRTGHRDFVASAIILSIRTLTFWFSKPS